MDETANPAEGEPITFLSVQDIQNLHRAAQQRYTPHEPPGIKDPGLLESAVLNPQQTMFGQYLYTSLAEIAAAYLISLAQNHAFEQGNKRVAFAACAVFLRRNGYQLTLTQEQATDLTLRVTTGTIPREEVVRIIENGVAFIP